MSIYVDYATTADLASFLGITVQTLPTDASRLLRRASEIVKQSMLSNYISSNSDHVEAAKLATCAQVESWMQSGEASAVGGKLQSFSLGELSMNYGSSGANSGNTLCGRSKAFLNQQGLCYRGINMRYREEEQV